MSERKFKSGDTMKRPHMNFTPGQIEQARKITAELRRHCNIDPGPVFANLTRARTYLNALGIYRLPGDKPLIHNGRKYRK